MNNIVLKTIRESNERTLRALNTVFFFVKLSRSGLRAFSGRINLNLVAHVMLKKVPKKVS